MIKPNLLRTSRIAAVLAVVLSLGGLANSARGSIALGFNPTGGGIGGTTNPGTITPVFTFDEDPGNAIAVGFNKPTTGGTGFRLPTVGETFDLVYQATVSTLKDDNGQTLFSYDAPNEGQLTVVTSFTERVTAVDPVSRTATFATTGDGEMIWYFSPTRVADPLTGTGFAPGAQGGAGVYTEVYRGNVLAGASGNFTSNTPNGQSAGNLDQAGTDNYPSTDTVAGQGSTLLNIQTTSYNPAFFTSAPPAAVLLQLFNTSNNLPFAQVNPSAIFYNGQPGVSSVGLINGGTDAAGNPLAANVMFQADANSSFEVVPEPGTISMAVTGVGLVSLGVLRARRRRGV